MALLARSLAQSRVLERLPCYLLNPPPGLPGPLARDTLPGLPARDACASLLAPAMPARHHNLVLRCARFRPNRDTARVRPVNPNAKLNLVAVRGTRGWTVPQGFQDRGLCLADAWNHFCRNLARRFET